MKLWILLGLVLAVVLLLRAQDGTPVNQVDGPPPMGVQQVYGYSGTNLTYVCSARSVVTTGIRAATAVSISGVSKASPAVVTSASHGFATSSRPSVTISGATGTGWTAINATWVATVTGANTFTIAVDSSGFGTLAGTVVFTTTAPRSGVPEWSVLELVYDGSNNLIWKGWLGGGVGYSQKCSDATSTTVAQQ